MSQKGGVYTVDPGFTLTAEQLLDKFSNTYLEKHIFPCDTVYYNLLNKLLTLGESEGFDHRKNNTWLMFDKTRNLFLEENHLNFEDIEKRIYGRIETNESHYITKKSMFSKEKIDHGLIFSLAKPCYIFKDRSNNPFPAYKPYIQKEDSSTNLWKLYVIKDGKSIYTNIEGDYESPEDFLFFITGNHTYVNGESEVQVSGYVYPDQPRIISNVDYFNRLKNEKKLINKLIYKLEGNKLKVIYAEPQGTTKWIFHPHSMLNMLPNTQNETILKNLFKKLSKDLIKIRDSKTNNYSIMPDKFFHIHVSKIPRENDILLTLHSLYEVTYRENEKERFEKYIYKNLNGSLHKSGRVLKPDYFSRINNNPEIKQQSRAHNAYVLLKPNQKYLSLYKSSKQNQAGNPFTNPEITIYDFTIRFAFGNSSFAVNKFDLNHVNGKGITIDIMKPEFECELFCNESNTNDFEIKDRDLRNKIKTFIRETSNPATPEEIKVWNEIVERGEVMTKNYTAPPKVTVPKKSAWNRFRLTKRSTRRNNRTRKNS